VVKNAARESVAMVKATDAPAGIMDVVVQNDWGSALSMRLSGIR
jgi:hypothetical protein